MRFTELGTRMKDYESINRQKLMPGLPVYCRIDGRAFHTFCRGLNKPFCEELVDTMSEVTKYLIEETHANLGYCQSDEISLCWLDVDKAPFDGKVFKLQSVLASMTASKFVSFIYSQTLKGVFKKEESKYFDLQEKILNNPPSFDCRVIQLPNEKELANMFVWRELDAVRNSIQMVAQANFSHKELQGINCNELQNKLLTEKDINWNDYPTRLKRGTYFKRFLIEKELEDEIWNKIPEDKKPESRMVIRSCVKVYDIPVMKTIENKVGVYFYNEEPIELC